MIQIMNVAGNTLIGDVGVNKETNRATIKDPRMVMIRPDPGGTGMEVLLMKLVGEPVVMEITTKPLWVYVPMSTDILDLYRRSTSMLTVPAPGLKIIPK